MPAPARSGIEHTLLWHYVTRGIGDGLEPIEFFDSRWYLEQHSDLAAAMRTGQIITPLGHFLRYGSAEGRDPGPAFSSAGYLDSRPEARTLAHETGKGPFGALVRLGGVAGRVNVGV